MHVAQRVAGGAGFEPRLARTGDFLLQTYFRAVRSGSRGLLDVYIEGDGRAWRTLTEPSSDPTPSDPIGLELAAADASGAAVLYIARPCQYVAKLDDACGPSVWTGARFSERAVAAVDHVVGTFARELGVSRIHLVGYSGGGVVAALVAARRADVDRLVTISAPLDHEAWTDLQKLTPLVGSLNPSDFAQRLTHVEQVHFIGTKDDIVPPAVIDAYMAHLAEGAPASKRVIEGFDHVCCWVKRWPELGAGSAW